MESEHPTDQELDDFVHFHLTADKAHAVGEHLRICAECNTRYRQRYGGKPGVPAVPDLSGPA